MTMTSNTTNGQERTPSSTTTDVSILSLKKIEKAMITVAVEGTSPYICQRWSEKAKNMMLAAMQTKTRAKKEARNPDADFQASMYRFDDGGYGIPAVAFKKAMVDAARLFDGVKMTELRAALHVIGDGREQLVRLIADAPRMREDTVRVGMGTADLRYRAEFWPWSVELNVEFVPRLLDAESVIAIIDAAGLGGVGEWRPGKSGGIYGKFQVAP